MNPDIRFMLSAFVDATPCVEECEGSGPLGTNTVARTIELSVRSKAVG